MATNLNGSTTATFAVTLSIPLERAISVKWNTEDGTGKAGVDYEASSGTVVFAPGETSKPIQVLVYGVDPDAPVSGKTFGIRIIPPSDAIVGNSLTECTIVVTDDEGTPVTTVQVATGPSGAIGSPGLSSYELAKLQGFEGTLEEYIARETAAGNAAEMAGKSAEISEMNANKAEQQAERAEQFAEISASGSDAYPSAAAAQAAINAGTEKRKYFTVWSNFDYGWVEKYENVAGVATPTGIILPTLKYITQFIQKMVEFTDISSKTALSEFKDRNGNVYALFDNNAQLWLTGLEKSVQDYLSESIDEFSTAIFYYADGKHLQDLRDKDGNIYAYFDNNAQLWLTGLEKSVQAALSNLAKSIDEFSTAIFYSADGKHLQDLRDKDGNIYAYFDNNAKLWLTGLEKSVQDYLSGGVISESSQIGAQQFDPAYSMHVELLRNTGKPMVNIPATLVKPVNRTGTAWIHNIQADVPPNQDHIVIDTPYRPDDGVVHPNLVHVPGKFLGYDYLLAITPYTDMNDQEENPCLYGSNDLLNFTLLPNVEQPIDDTPANTEGRPGYLSDPFWGYNTFTGELMCCYRKTYVIEGSGADNDLFLLLYRSTKDGITWGEPTILMNEEVGSDDLILSPSIVYNANEGKWYLFYFQRDDVMVYRTNRTLDPSAWSEPVNCGFKGYGGWHLEVKFVGNRLVCLINDYRQTANIYLGISDPDDWSKWEFSQRPLLNKPGNNRGAYKSTFMPAFNANGEISLTIGWTTGDTTRNLYINQTNYFNAGK